jgi:hypothetical protein
MIRHFVGVGLLALVTLSLSATDSSAGPFRKRCRPVQCCPPPPYCTVPSATAAGAAGSLDELTRIVKELKKVIEQPMAEEKAIPTNVAKLFDDIKNKK